MEIVRKMIDGALAAERDGLDGFAYVDMRGITSGPMAKGTNGWSAAADELRHYGMPVVSAIPRRTCFPADYPMDHAAIYLGWYAGRSTGRWRAEIFDSCRAPIAVHIHSFSAATLRDPRANWAAPLLAHGAAATLGNVYEPYLALTPHLDIFVDRLRNGFTFAESAYASRAGALLDDDVRGRSALPAVPGDRRRPPESGEKPAIEYAAYKEGARTWYEKGRAAGEKQLEASARQLQSGIVWEGLGLLQWSMPDYDAALASFRQAEQCYGTTEDGLRAVLHQVEILKAEGKTGPGARAGGEGAAEEYEAFHGAALLRGDDRAAAPADNAKMKLAERYGALRPARGRSIRRRADRGGAPPEIELQARWFSGRVRTGNSGRWTGAR